MTRAFAVGLALALPVTAGLAQDSGQIRPIESIAGRRGGQPGIPRARLEKQLGQRLALRAKTVLNLSDDQMTRLQQVDGKYEDQQRSLDLREGQTRRELRDMLQGAPSADQERRTGELTDQLIQLQRQRLDAIQAEQKELSGFLSNTQRARFQALRENFRRQLQDVVAPGAGRRGKPPTG